MRGMIAVVAVAALVAGVCIAAFAMGQEYQRGQSVAQPYWSRGLGALADRSDRVYGYWVNWNDWLFYAGDTDALNGFLAQYAELPERPLRVVLHPGKGLVGKFGVADAKRTEPFDWELAILRRGENAQLPELSRERVSESITVVEVWLGGHVQLDKIKVPLNVEVVSGGEIESFVAAHEEARRAQHPGK